MMKKNNYKATSQIDNLSPAPFTWDADIMLPCNAGVMLISPGRTTMPHQLTKTTD